MIINIIINIPALTKTRKMTGNTASKKFSLAGTTGPDEIRTRDLLLTRQAL